MCRIAPPFIAAVWAASLLTAAAADQPAPPDWTGHYKIANGKDLAGFKPVSPNLNQVVPAHLQPWALTKMEATDGVADDPGAICQPIGIFRYPLLAGEFEWLPGKDKITMIYWEINTAGVRRIYLNRKEHPKTLLPTFNGDSIGHWEGDTLVVDTIGFNDKSWLHTDREPHTEETHLMERIRQVGNGAFIEVQGVVEDRQALTSAYAYSRYYRKQDAEMQENVCNDDIRMWKYWKNEHLRPQIVRSHEVK
jgi:hypothetical protein